MMLTFGLLLLTTTMAAAQPVGTPPNSEVPVVIEFRRPCSVTQDGPKRPTIVGRDGRFDQRCYDPSGVLSPDLTAAKRRIAWKTPITFGRR